MGRLRSGSAAVATILLFLWVMSGCGGHTPPRASPYPAKINLNPSTSVSLQAGGVIVFLATAQNSSNGTISAAFTYESNNTSIVNVSPTGIACAGHWDVTNTICTAGGFGVAQITANALGSTSPPTYVFVHPPIDDIQVNGILLNNVPIQEPCLSSGQTMTVEAHAYSQGADITSSVGPFTWSANNLSVVKITPLINATGSPIYSFPTNQATVAAVTPGTTQIYASASGVTSTTFYQPQYQNTAGATSPLLDFYETCPIQNIALEVGPAGSQQSDQTSFVAAKGTAQNVTAIITDVMGNNSVPNATTVTLSKIPLTWVASQPAVVASANGCTETCSISTPSVGAGAVTAACSPPTCNIGFPEIPVALSTTANLDACASFFNLPSCAPFIPLPVYSSPPCSTVTGAPNQCPKGGPPVTAAVTGLVTGATGASSVLVTSSGCAPVNPLDCSTGMYNISTNRDVVGSPILLPYSPTSLLFDLGGDKAYMGSELASIIINPTNIGASSSAFTPLGLVTGKVLAVSNSGTLAIFSDPRFNEVFVVNSNSTGSPAVTVLNIAQATVAAFSPDGLRAYIYGFAPNGTTPNLYVYSQYQALQTIPLPANTTVNAIAFSTNGAFAYVVEPSLAGGGPSVTVYNNCVHDASSAQLVADSFALTSPPVIFKTLPDGMHFVALEDNGTFDYITATVSGLPIATQTAQALPGCPLTVADTKTNYSLNVGALQGLNIFSSADGSMLYVLASNLSSVLVYHFSNSLSSPGTISGIQLVGNNVTPLSGSMSADAGTIAITGSDGLFHIVSTVTSTDLNPPLTFPNLPDYLGPFCTDATVPCPPNLVALKP
jgi:hypothetical protein